jgi:uncharacterized OsmC-like protein
MTTHVQTTVNGVAVEALVATINAMKNDPSLGEAHFRLRNRWVNGGLNRSTIQGFFAAGGEDTSRTQPFVYDNDEPPVLLGENRGANPVEYLLHGLAGCVTTTFVYYAAANGVEIESLESTLEGDIDLRGLLGAAPVNAGYQNIRIAMKVTSSAPPEKLRELALLAQRRSPVFNSVSKPVPVSVTIDKL